MVDRTVVRAEKYHTFINWYRNATGGCADVQETT